MTVVAEAQTGEQAVELAGSASPEVVLMNIRTPGVNGLEATRRLRKSSSAPAVLILTTFDTDVYVYQALKAGAAGFLLKSAPPARLVEAVRTVHSGEALLAPSVTKRLIESYVQRAETRSTPPEPARLTGREREVLVLLAQGRSNSEMTGLLFLSEATVKTHVNHVLTKLGVRDRVQAVVLPTRPGSPTSDVGSDEPNPLVSMQTLPAATEGGRSAHELHAYDAGVGCQIVQFKDLLLDGCHTSVVQDSRRPVEGSTLSLSPAWSCSRD